MKITHVVGLFCLLLVPAWGTPPEIDVPAATREPSVQGDPNDPAWSKAAVLPPLTEGFGVTSPGPLPKTEIRLLWSPKALYIRYIAQDSAVIVPYTARDADHFKGDVAEVFLDPAGTQRVWYEFQITPHNGVYDAIHLCTTEPQSGPDGVLNKDILSHNVWTFKEWNCQGLQTVAHEIQGGWIIEIAISPDVLRSTGASEFHAGPLRANFLRYDYDNPTGPARYLLNWSQVVTGRPHRSPARMGTLHLLPAAG
jgi:hypothetical protein